MKKKEILVFSADPAVISPLKSSFSIVPVSSRSEALKRAGETPGIPAVIDCDMKDGGLALFKEIKRASPDSAVVMLSSTVTVQEAVEASKIGVADFIRKPALDERLVGSVRSNLLRGGAEIKLVFRPHEWMLGGGSKIRALFNNIEFALGERKNILFVAEPGIDVSGLAKVISGQRKLTSIDMFAFGKENLESIFWTVLQEALASSDIIYFERFGAVEEKLKSSILDYIKSKALRGNLTVMAGVQDADESAVFADWEKITVPPLRERKEDIPDMLGAYIDKFGLKYGKRIEGISLGALRTISDYSWPGNYRELECVIENAVIACEGGSITIKDIPLGGKMAFENLRSPRTENLLDFKNNVERGLIDIFFRKTGSEDATANLLDIPKARISEGLKR